MSDEPVIRHVSHAAIVAMLGDACREEGYTLRQFYEEATDRDDPWRIRNPVLRDLWLIWGRELTEEDL